MAQPPTRHGFTLIELLLAVALSALLLLVAFITFRATTRTMQELRTLAEENRVLRTGYLQVAKDADHWHSHADPRYPYLREHNGLDAGEDSVFDVRPFRRVEWEASLAVPENPNWALPHDPRAWYRNHLQPNTTTGRYVWINGTATVPGHYGYEPDFAFDHSSSGDRGVRPPGWDNWHVLGDYAALSNIDQTDDLGFRPRQQWEIAKRLGIRGLVTYLHAGALNLIQASSVNERQDNYSGMAEPTRLPIDVRIDSNFRKGEIPWSLNFTSDLVEGRRLAVRSSTARVSDDYVSYPPSFKTLYPEWNRGNYAVAQQSRLDSARNDGIALQPFPLASDFQVITGDCLAKSLGKLDGSLGVGSYLPMAMMYPGNPLRERLGSATWDWSEYLYDTYRPLTVIDLPDATVDNAFEAHSVSSVGRARKLSADALYRTTLENHTHTTSHLPMGHTDELGRETDAADLHGMRLSTSVFRLLHAGDDRCQARVQYRNQDGSRSSALHLRLLSTTYRGARQYWGRFTGRDGLLVDGRRVRLGDWYGN